MTAHEPSARRRTERGMSLPELLIVLALVGIVVSIAGLYLRPAEMPLQTGVELTEGFLRQARMKAIANTSAYRVTAPSDGVLLAEYAPSCDSATWTPNDLDVELPDDVKLGATDWSVCFTARGVSSSNVAKSSAKRP